MRQKNENICRANREIIQRLREDFKPLLNEKEKSELAEIENELMDMYGENKRIQAELAYNRTVTTEGRKKKSDFRNKEKYLKRWRPEIECFQKGKEKFKLMYLKQFKYKDTDLEVPDDFDHHEVTIAYKKIYEKCKSYYDGLDKKKKKVFEPTLKILRILIYKTYRMKRKIDEWEKIKNR